MNSDITIRHAAAAAGKEIKASAHYTYVLRGITLDGSKFTLNELILEGQCLVMDNTTKKYEKYVETTPGTFEPLKSNPMILDESIKFLVTDEGINPDLTAGQVLVHGAVHTSMLVNYTAAFKAAIGGAIRFVD